MSVTVLKGIIRSRLAESRPVKLFVLGRRTQRPMGNDRCWYNLDASFGGMCMSSLTKFGCLVWQNLDVSFGRICMSLCQNLHVLFDNFFVSLGRKKKKENVGVGGGSRLAEFACLFVKICMSRLTIFVSLDRI